MQSCCVLIWTTLSMTAQAQSSIVISQVYGGGGNTGATAIRARLPSRQSSAVEADLTGSSMAGVFRFFMHGNRHEDLALCSLQSPLEEAIDVPDELRFS